MSSRVFSSATEAVKRGMTVGMPIGSDPNMTLNGVCFIESCVLELCANSAIGR